MPSEKGMLVKRIGIEFAVVRATKEKQIPAALGMTGVVSMTTWDSNYPTNF